MARAGKHCRQARIPSTEVPVVALVRDAPARVWAMRVAPQHTAVLVLPKVRVGPRGVLIPALAEPSAVEWERGVLSLEQQLVPAIRRPESRAKDVEGDRKSTL